MVLHSIGQRRLEKLLLETVDTASGAPPWGIDDVLEMVCVAREFSIGHRQLYAQSLEAVERQQWWQRAIRQ